MPFDREGRMQGFGVPERNLAKNSALPAPVLQCYSLGKGRESNAAIPFLPFLANSAAMFCLPFLASMEGQRGNMSRFQFWLSSSCETGEFLLTCFCCTKFIFPMWFFSTSPISAVQGNYFSDIELSVVISSALLIRAELLIVFLLCGKNTVFVHRFMRGISYQLQKTEDKEVQTLNEEI